MTQRCDDFAPRGSYVAARDGGDDCSSIGRKIYDGADSNGVIAVASDPLPGVFGCSGLVTALASLQLLADVAMLHPTQWELVSDPVVGVERSGRPTNRNLHLQRHNIISAYGRLLPR